MKFLVTLLNITLILIIIGSLVIGGILGYRLYEKEKRKEYELSYATDQEWEWHQVNLPIQRRLNGVANFTSLRRVYMDKKYVITARKFPDYSLATKINFITPCEPNSKIETEQIWKDNTAIVLRCTEEGDSLYIISRWESDDTDLLWDVDIRGFSFVEDFNRWDFELLDREITLSKAEKESEESETDKVKE